MKIEAAGIAALLVVFGPTIASAGPAVDAATRAESLASEGKVAEAIDALSGAIDGLCQASPLAFRKILVVDSSSGYGVYSERADKSFKPDDKMMVYVEPVCLAAGADGKVSLKADLGIENTKGQVLGEAKDVFSISVPERQELSTTLSFGVPYLRPGDYKAVFTVHDQNSSKTGTFEVPFSITLPTSN
jgi:hypothetical protein